MPLSRRLICHVVVRRAAGLARPRGPGAVARSGAARAGRPARRRPQRARQPRPRADAATRLSDAVRRVERATGGQVLSAERVQYDGRDVNRIKVVDDRGRVRVYMDDPQAAAASRDDSARGRRTRDDDD